MSPQMAFSQSGIHRPREAIHKHSDDNITSCHSCGTRYSRGTVLTQVQPGSLPDTATVVRQKKSRSRIHLKLKLEQNKQLLFNINKCYGDGGAGHERKQYGPNEIVAYIGSHVDQGVYSKFETQQQIVWNPIKTSCCRTEEMVAGTQNM